MTSPEDATPAYDLVLPQAGDLGEREAGHSKGMHARAARIPRARAKRACRVEITFGTTDMRRLTARAQALQLALPEYIRAVLLDDGEEGGPTVAAATGDAHRAQWRRVLDLALWVLGRLEAQARPAPLGASLCDHVAAVAASCERHHVCALLEELVRHVAEFTSVRNASNCRSAPTALAAESRAP